MSEDNSNGDQSTTSDDNVDPSVTEPDGKGSNSNESVESLKRDLQEAIKRRDSAAKRAREAENALKDRDEAQKALEKEKAEKSNDLESLKKNWGSERQALEAKLQGIEGDLRRHVIKNNVFSAMTKYVVEGAEDAFWKLSEEFFDMETDEDTGMKRAVVKHNPYQSVEEFIKESVATKWPWFQKNKRQPGTGKDVNPGKDGNTPGKPTLAEIRNLPDQKKAFKDNPELALEVLKSFGRP